MIKITNEKDSQIVELIYDGESDTSMFDFKGGAIFNLDKPLNNKDKSMEIEKSYELLGWFKTGRFKKGQIIVIQGTLTFLIEEAYLKYMRYNPFDDKKLDMIQIVGVKELNPDPHSSRESKKDKDQIIVL